MNTPAFQTAIHPNGFVIYCNPRRDDPSFCIDVLLTHKQLDQFTPMQAIEKFVSLLNSHWDDKP